MSDLSDPALPGRDADPSRVSAIDRDALTRLDRVSRESISLQGRRDALISRQTQLSDSVAASKGRIALKPEVESVIEDLQRFAHERSVGAFERLLTAITDDVLPNPAGNRSIRLELTTERNSPALDIYADHGGQKEPITSGALANVVSTGLRFVTLARSGLRRFIILDEADCWVSTDSVQKFFNVVRQLSSDAGIQTLVITHHDLSDFMGDFRIYRVGSVSSDDPWANRTPELLSQGWMEKSDLQDDWISSVSVQDFEAYRNARIDLSPGVTAIVGENGHGKSTWTRALKAALMGEASDGMIRHGKAKTNVQVEFSDGRCLEYRRVRKGNPKAEFILHSPESRADPTVPPLHHSPTARLPEWLPKETGVSLIDGIDVQLWGQFSPVFMLNEPPSRRAELLAIGRESGYLYAMNELYKEDLRSDNTTIREGEKEIGAIRSVLERLAPLDGLSGDTETLRRESVEVNEQAARLRSDAELIDAIELSTEQTRRLKCARDALAGLPSSVPTLDDIAPLAKLIDQIERTQVQSRILAAEKAVLSGFAAEPPEPVPTESLVRLIEGIEHLKRRLSILTAGRGVLDTRPQIEPSPVETADLTALIDGIQRARALAATRPPAIVEAPVLADTRDLADLIVQINESARKADLFKAQLVETNKTMESLRAELEELAQTISNECPVCKSFVDAEVLLSETPHRHPKP
jgi:DNA repair ATPase RecN